MDGSLSTKSVSGGAAERKANQIDRFLFVGKTCKARRVFPCWIVPHAVKCSVQRLIKGELTGALQASLDLQFDPGTMFRFQMPCNLTMMPIRVIICLLRKMKR